VDFLSPRTWEDALSAKAEYPDAVPVAGGTDVMVDLNFDRLRPNALLDLTRIVDLHDWAYEGSTLRVGAGVSYTRVIEELRRLTPGLAMAARTIGSPQIRNRGTVGGNLGSASPAGDAHPPLLAAGATVQVASVRGTRAVPIEEFFTGPKRNVLEPDELISAFGVPMAQGPQQFSKVGTRNAMVIAVASFAIALDVGRERVGTGIGSAGPTPLRANEAEGFLEGELTAGSFWERPRQLAPTTVARFSQLVAGAASPIDDVRGTATYRRHALVVMAGRALSWAWDEYAGVRE
jgi:CO/xanthine dehydrogenase FAD-binding subunit